MRLCLLSFFRSFFTCFQPTIPEIVRLDLFEAQHKRLQAQKQVEHWQSIAYTMDTRIRRLEAEQSKTVSDDLTQSTWE